MCRDSYATGRRFEGLLATIMVKAAFPSALHSRICWRSPSASSLRRPPRMGSGSGCRFHEAEGASIVVDARATS